MKKISSILTIVFLGSFAAAQLLPGKVKGLPSFAAPIVYGSPTVTDTQVGSIVYDLSTHGFSGFFENGAWGPITQGSVFAPSITNLSGSGLYVTPAGTLYLKVRMVGQGGGGSGSGIASGGNGMAGAATTFGLHTANGGSGGFWNGNGGSGGSYTIGAGAVGTGIMGSSGSAGAAAAASGYRMPGAAGGGSGIFGGGGSASDYIGAGANGNPDSGGAGQGGGNFAVTNCISGSGGGGGGALEIIIANPAPTYSYTTGTTGGAAGTLGSSGANGGAGAAGHIEVTAFYQ